MGELIELSEKRVIKVVKKKKDLWVVYFSINKKRKQKSFVSRESANKWIAEFEDFVKGKRKVATNQGTEVELGACIFEMLEYQLERDLISTSTYSTYWSYYINYFDSSYKKTKLHQIDANFVDNLRKDLKNNKVGGKRSNGTKMKCAVTLLKKVYKHASAMGYKNINCNLEDFKTPVEKKESKTYTIEDFNKLKKSYLSYNTQSSSELNKKRFAGVLLLNMQLGLRSGELRALKFEDFDLEKKIVSISKTVTRSKEGRPIIGRTTKSKKTRQVPITDFGVEIINFLYNYKSNCNSSSGNICGKTFVLGLSNFKPIGDKILARYIKVATREAGIAYLPNHSACRKTMATLITTNLKGKVDPFTIAKQVQKILGHSDISTTLNSYIFPASMNTDDLFAVFDDEKETGS